MDAAKGRQFEMPTVMSEAVSTCTRLVYKFMWNIWVEMTGDVLCVLQKFCNVYVMGAKFTTDASNGTNNLATLPLRLHCLLT